MGNGNQKVERNKDGELLSCARQGKGQVGRERDSSLHISGEQPPGRKKRG